MQTGCRLCTFHLDHLWFGVAVERVQEVMSSPSITPVPLAPRGVAGLVNLRGQIVTVIDLGRRLGFRERPAAASPAMVMVRSDNTVVGLLVDEIGDVLEVSETLFERQSETLFERPPETLKGIARELIRGAYKLRDKLLLILDPERTVNL